MNIAKTHENYAHTWWTPPEWLLKGNNMTKYLPELVAILVFLALSGLLFFNGEYIGGACGIAAAVVVVLTDRFIR